MRWVTNSIEKPSMIFEADERRWIESVRAQPQMYLMGEPLPSETVTVEELKAMGYVGVYRLDLNEEGRESKNV